jgi:metalloprotein, YbeY/UPF0054 family
MRNIRFFAEDTDFQPKQKGAIRQWITNSAAAEGFKTGNISIVFCSDAYLLEINQRYLSHDTFTDIVTFDNSEKEAVIAGDIFISIDRVRENAVKFAVSEQEELHRVIIHGVLHLCGYKDKTKKDKALMTEKEDFYLSMCPFAR